MSKRTINLMDSNKRSRVARSSLNDGNSSCQPIEVDFIDRLPPELSLLIFSFIPPTCPSIMHISLCSKMYNIFLSDSETWRHHLYRVFPHLMNTLYCIKSFLDHVSPKDACDFITQWDISESRIEGWIREMKAADMRIPPRDFKKFFFYLYRFRKEEVVVKFKRHALSDFAIAIKDFSLLRSVMSMSVQCLDFGFRKHAQFYDISDLNKIAKSLPQEFPSVSVSGSQDWCVPVCYEYVSIGDARNYLDLLNDFTFEHIGNHPTMCIKGVRMYDVPNDVIVQCLSTLRLDELTDAVRHIRSSLPDCRETTR